MNMLEAPKALAIAAALVLSSSLPTLGGSAAAEAAPTTTAAARPSPRAWLEEKVKEAHEIASRKVEPDSPAEKKWQADAKRVIDSILDWEELTRRSLGSNWRDLDRQRQDRFRALLRKLIESSYRSRLRYAVRQDVEKPKEVKIDWLEEDVSGSKAELVAKVSAAGETALLGFDLRWTEEDRWRVYDVSIDELSTVRTYRSNFNKILKKEGWEALVRRLEQKIEDIEAGRADFAKPEGLSGAEP